MGIETITETHTETIMEKTIEMAIEVTALTEIEEVCLDKDNPHTTLEGMTEVAVDPHQGQHKDQGQVQEAVKIETESGVTTVESMITLLTIVQTQTQMRRQTGCSNCIIQMN